MQELIQVLIVANDNFDLFRIEGAGVALKENPKDHWKVGSVM